MSVDHSENRYQGAETPQDGSLLLWMGGGKIYALNDVAELIWKRMEESAEGLVVEDLADYLEEVYSGSGVARERFIQDVDALVSELSQFGVLEARDRRFAGGVRYRIKDDVFRAEGSEAEMGAKCLVSDSDIANLPMAKRGTLGKEKWLDGITAFIALCSYELILRLKGFGYLCRVVERGLPAESPLDVERIRQICGGLERARVWYPRAVKCLQHSAVITWLLRREGVPAKMVIAARRVPFYAHAWSEINGTVINDRQSVQAKYKVFRRCLCDLKESESVGDEDRYAVRSGI